MSALFEKAGIKLLQYLGLRRTKILARRKEVGKHAVHLGKEVDEHAVYLGVGSTFLS